MRMMTITGHLGCSVPSNEKGHKSESSYVFLLFRVVERKERSSTLHSIIFACLNPYYKI